MLLSVLGGSVGKRRKGLFRHIRINIQGRIFVVIYMTIDLTDLFPQKTPVVSNVGHSLQIEAKFWVIKEAELYSANKWKMVGRFQDHPCSAGNLNVPMNKILLKI